MSNDRGLETHASRVPGMFFFFVFSYFTNDYFTNRLCIWNGNGSHATGTRDADVSRALVCFYLILTLLTNRQYIRNENGNHDITRYDETATASPGTTNGHYHHHHSTNNRNASHHDGHPLNTMTRREGKRRKGRKMGLKRRNNVSSFLP